MNRNHRIEHRIEESTQRFACSMATLSDAREQQHRLQRFWAAQSRHFTAWFLALPSAGQLVVIRAAAPDMREASPAEGEPTKATDVLVPELTQSGLLSDGGRGLIRLYAQRVNLGVGGADAFDVMMLMKLHAQARMPCFAGEALNGLALSWVDPADPRPSAQKFCLACRASCGAHHHIQKLTVNSSTLSLTVAKDVRKT